MARRVHRLRSFDAVASESGGLGIYWGKLCVVIPPNGSISGCEASVVLRGFFVNETRFFAATLFLVWS